MKTILNCLIVILLLTNSAAGQENQQIWYGVLDVGVAKLRLELRIEQADDGSASGELVSLDQGNVKVPFDSIEISDGKLQFEIEKLNANFEGSLNEALDQCEGTFTQFGNARKITFDKTINSAAPTHVETWQGSMVAGRNFEFQLRIFKDKEGKRSGVLDSFTENITGLPIELKDGDSFDFEVAATAAKYSGSYSDDRKNITGKWKQGPGEFDLNFKSVPIENTKTTKKTDAAEQSAPKRPQTPKPPFDYLTSDFNVTSKKNDKVQLAGTLSLPKGDGPFPAAILISGSGPQDRDCTIYGHKSFLVIADHFAKQGIAVLRYDERGVGKSTGDFTTATSKDFADDVEELLDWLKEQPKIDSDRLVLIGHSEGGIVGPMVAARRDDVAKLVVLSGPFVNGEEIVLNQTRKIAAVSGVNQSFLNSQDALMRKLLLQIKEGKSLTIESVDLAVEKIINGLPEQEKGSFVYPAAARQRLVAMSSPWFEFFLTYEPAPTFEQVKCPVLVINGDNDLQVDPDINLPIAEKILLKRTNKDWEIIRPENLNHLFQTSETGSPTQYPLIEETFDLEVLQTMADWVNGK